MHTLRQPFAAAANHFLELRLDFGEAGRPIHCHDCVAPAAAPAAAERGEDAGEGESVVEGEVPRPSLSESDEFSHERATRRGSSGPSENGPRKGSRGQPQLGRPKASSEQQKGGEGWGIAQAATPAAATFRRSAGARARCGAKTTCTKKDPAAGEGARRCGAACGAASAGSSSSLAQERICGDC